MFAKFQSWLKQPTTVAGLAGLAGTLTAAITGQLTWAAAVPMLVGSLVAMVLPDNTGARTESQALATALVDKLSAGLTPPPK